MAHAHDDRPRLLARIKRIQGQTMAIERALGEAADCSAILQTIAACRGALTSLMAEVIDDHVQFHVLDAKGRASRDQREAADLLMDVVKAYLR